MAVFCRVMTAVTFKIDSMTVPSDEAEALKRRYRLLQQRCARLQQDNERLVHRIYQVKRMTKRYKKEIKFLMDRLDMHGDAFRTFKTEEEASMNLSMLEHLESVKTERGTSRSSDRFVAAGKKTGVKRKAKTERRRDSSAKKPIASFNQYYSDQGPLVIAEGTSESNEMRQKWRTTGDDKKQRAMLFERSKQKYEMISSFIKRE